VFTLRLDLSDSDILPFIIDVSSDREHDPADKREEGSCLMVSHNREEKKDTHHGEDEDPSS
jgi:hypothetical protein